MTSGEITSAGRSPACSEPSTGSRRTRTTSPRLRLCVESTVDLLLQRVVLALDVQVDACHLAAALDHLAPELLSPLPFQPFAQEPRDDGAPLSRIHRLLELLQEIGRQGIRPLQ